MRVRVRVYACLCCMCVVARAPVLLSPSLPPSGAQGCHWRECGDCVAAAQTWGGVQHAGSTRVRKGLPVLKHKATPAKHAQEMFSIQRNRERHKHTRACALIQTRTHLRSHRHTDTQTHRHTDTQTHRHTHRHTDRYRHTCRPAPCPLCCRTVAHRCTTRHFMGSGQRSRRCWTAAPVSAWPTTMASQRCTGPALVDTRTSLG